MLLLDLLLALCGASLDDGDLSIPAPGRTYAPVPPTHSSDTACGEARPDCRRPALDRSPAPLDRRPAALDRSPAPLRPGPAQPDRSLLIRDGRPSNNFPAARVLGDKGGRQADSPHRLDHELALQGLGLPSTPKAL